MEGLGALVEKAVGMGFTPRQLYDAATKRLESLSQGMPPKKVIYNACYGSFAYSRHFQECFPGRFASRHDPALAEAMSDFGRANAKMFPKAFSAYVIYEKYDIDNMIRKANALHLGEQNARDIEGLIEKIRTQVAFGSTEATYQEVRTSQSLHGFTRESLERVGQELEAELSLSVSSDNEPSYFKDRFYPAYKRYQETKGASYYEPGNMLSSLLKDANNPKAWFSAPGYQAFGMSFLYDNSASAPAGKAYDPFSGSFVDVPEESYEGFGLLCASGDNSNLRFAEVPALVEYYVTSEDGLEEVRWELPPQLPGLRQ